jgi:hypothetical protein
MKLIKLEFSDGFATSFSFNGELISINIENNGVSLVEEEVKKLDHTKQVTLGLFAGLWYTSKGMFVIVDADNRGTIIGSKGEAYLLTNFNKEGYSEEAGSLEHKKRGDEEYVDKEFNIRWPVLKETR